MGVEAGMQSLLARRATELEAGAEPVGWKVGINVPAVQRRLGIAGAVAGYLTSDGVLTPGETVSIAGWTAPAIEPEIAIRVDEDGGVAALSPALEFVDVDLPFDDVEAILAGNVFHRGVCLGPSPRVRRSPARHAVCLQTGGRARDRRADRPRGNRRRGTRVPGPPRRVALRR